MPSISGLTDYYNLANDLVTRSGNDVSIRDVFAVECSKNISNATPEPPSYGKDFTKVVTNGENGWSKISYTYEAERKETVIYQKSLKLSDEKEYQLHSWANCYISDNNARYFCETSIKLYLGNSMLAEASDKCGHLEMKFGTRETLDMLGEAVFKAARLELKATIDGHNKFVPDYEGVSRNTCVVAATQMALRMLNDYIEIGNYAMDHYPRESREGIVNDRYESTFQKLMKVQEETVKAHPSCATNGDLLFIQQSATDKLNEIRGKLRERAQSYWDFLIDNEMNHIAADSISQVGGTVLFYACSSLGWRVFGGILAFLPTVGSLVKKTVLEDIDTKKVQNIY